MQNSHHFRGAARSLLAWSWFCVFLLAASAFGQAPSQPEAPQASAPTPEAQSSEVPAQGAIRISTNLVMIDATVKTKAGKIMDGLKQSDFEVREDGVVQKLQVFSRDALPLNVVLLLDTSASTGPFLRPLRFASTQALSALKPEDEVALMSFSSEALLRTPFTKNKPEVAAELTAFQTGGTTNINDALFVAARYLRTEAPSGRRVIILISDNVATDAGKYETPEIVRELLAADTAVYSLKLPDFNSADSHKYAQQLVGLVDLRQVLQETGGEQFEIKDVLHMDSVFRDLIDRIKTRYTLGYYVSADQPSGRQHKLAISLIPSFGKEGRNYILLAKSGYISP